MIRNQTSLKVCDNSGALVVQCIQPLKKAKLATSSIGEILVVSVKKALPHKKITKGMVYYGLIIRTKKNITRLNQFAINFSDNSVILLTKDKTPLGTRIFGPVLQELRKFNFLKVLSLATKIL